MAGSIDEAFTSGQGLQTVSADSTAPPDATWALLATPAWWHVWAPHIRRVSDGTRGRAAPADLAIGQRLTIHGPALVSVQARITRVDPGRRWDFAVTLPGPWTIVNAHLVEPSGTGSRVVVHMVVDGPGGRLLSDTALAAYVPLAAYSLRRLSRLAERDHAAATAALDRLGRPLDDD
jgi:hypothetical protein